MPNQGNLIIIYLLKPLGKDEIISRGRYPLHVTIVPWFNVLPNSTVIKNIKEIAHNTIPIPFEVGNRAFFGSNQDIPVNILVPNKKLNALHETFVAAIEEVGGEFIEPQYTKVGYGPHISHMNKLKPYLGESHLLDKITLLKLSSDKETCKVIDCYKLLK